MVLAALRGGSAICRQAPADLMVVVVAAHRLRHSRAGKNRWPPRRPETEDRRAYRSRLRGDDGGQEQPSTAV